MSEDLACLILQFYKDFIFNIKFVRKTIRLAIDLEYENYIVYIYIRKLESEFTHLYWEVLHNTRQYDTSGLYQEPPQLI
jgi:hypothetical protein